MTAYKKNDVISVITVAGEYIGKFKDATAEGVTIDDPKMLVTGKEGVGFGHGICVTGEDNPRDMTFYTGSIVFITRTSEVVRKAYHSANSGLIV